MKFQQALQAYQTGINLTTPSQELADATWDLVAWEGWTRTSTPGPYPNLELTATHDGYGIIEEQETVYSSNQISKSLRVLASLIHQRTAETSPFLFIHSAALTLGDKLVLFPGPSQAGKSTLASELCLRGARYFSDEYAVIDPVNGLVYSFPRPLRLRNGKEFYPSLASEPRAIEAVFFLKYMGTVGDNSISRCTAGEATLGLFQNLVTAQRWKSSALPILSQALQHSRCFRGTRTEAYRTAELLETLLEI